VPLLFFLFNFFLFCFTLVGEKKVRFRFLGTFHKHITAIMAKAQELGMSTMHSTICKKSFCWFSFLGKGNSFSSLFEKFGMLHCPCTWLHLFMDPLLKKHINLYIKR
jgi:hypothetical protein